MDTHTTTRPITHPLHVGYLVSGLVCCGIAGLWALSASDRIGADELGWLFPLLLVVAGAVGVLAMLVRGTTGGGATRLDDTDTRDVPGLEAEAFAPYPRDEERTRVLDTHTDDRSKENDDE